MYVPTTRVEGTPIHQGLDTVSYLGPRYLREPTGDFSDTRLSAKLGSLTSNALVLLPEDVSHISLDTLPDLPNIRLTEIPELGRGRQNSRTGVKFGQLHISNNTAAPIAELVAAKFIHRLTAPRELNAARALNHRFGQDLAFRPLGFVRHPDGRTGYLSRYEHDVTTLDNVLWNETASETQRCEAMGFAGLWLASLHNHGLIHGDAQAKNIAYDSSRQPRFVDLEGMHDISHGALDTQTTRLLDIANLFDPTYMLSTSPDEEITFVDSYLEHQDPQRIQLEGEDIVDTIRSTQE